MKRELSDLLGWLIIAVLTVAIVALLVLVVQWLWNHVVVHVIVAAEINFWQALGLIALAAVLTMDKKILFSWMYEDR